MKRHLVALLAIGLVAGALAPAQAAKKKKPKPKPPAPVAVDVTYHVVWDGETCVLSTTTQLAAEGEYCADIFAGAPAATGENAGPWVMNAVDGLPLTLDAAKPVKGTFQMESFVLDDAAPIPMGAGNGEVELILSATSAGEELALGEATATYQVTPAAADYTFEFEIQPPAALTGKVLDTLTLSVEVVGDTVFHGATPADGSSKLTLGAFALPQ
jgi:hypothetical protein